MLAILYHVLQMNKDGMKCLSFFENDDILFHCESDMDSVSLYKNQAGTFKDHNLVIDSDDKKVIYVMSKPPTLVQSYQKSENHKMVTNRKSLVSRKKCKTEINQDKTTWEKMT